jgi:catechol 2,3-dioxygenase-like lactoylglutathione lyase family enzyme
MIRQLILPALCLMGSPAAAQSAAPAIPAENIVGPALYVTDPERSLKFYTEGLGMKLRMRFGPAGRPDMVVGFGTNPTDAGIMLVTDKEGPIHPIEHSHGFDRIAIRLPGLEGVAVRLKAAGFQAGDIRLVHGFVRMMLVADPDGYRIELIDSLPIPRNP